jgi:TetR/AcrR family transcriptional regulator
MPTTARSKIRLGTRGRPEESRAAILKAAICEFADEGVAGARIDAIARAAHVNKALLYYYFKDKDALYGAVLDHVFEPLTRAIHAALEQPLPPRQRFLAYVAAHFDYVASNPLYPRVVQSNMMWAGRRSVRQFERVVKKYLKPMFEGVGKLIQEGVASGDFRKVNPLHFMSMAGTAIVSYFIHAPMMRLVTGGDPLSAENIAERRVAVLDFLSAALFREPNKPSEKERRQGERQ